MNKPKLVLLDFDGVVVKGSNEAYFSCYHKALVFVGVNLSSDIEHERVLKGWGSGHVSQLQILLKEHTELVEKAAQEWIICAESPLFYENIKPVKGVGKAIKIIEKNARVAIVSGSRRDYIQKLLDRFGIDGERKIFSSYDVVDPALHKPNPYTIQLALDYFECSPSDAVYVGDMPNDIKMARAAGVEPVIVLTGELDEQGAQKLGVKIIKSDLLAFANEIYAR